MRKVKDPAAAVDVALRALQKRRLRREDLSARRVAELLGQTTGFLYHHFESFDDFLLEVSGKGWRALVAALVSAYDARKRAGDIPVAYVRFGLAYPDLYWLMADRPMNAAMLRRRAKKKLPIPSYAAWEELLSLMQRVAPGVTPADARLLHAAVHGLLAQRSTGRIATWRERAREDAVALALAEHLGETWLATFTRASPAPARRTTARRGHAA